MLLRPDSMRMEANVTEAMLKNEGASQATVGTIVDDSESGFFKVIIGAVVAAVVLVLICLLVVLFRYMYRHKGTYHTNEAKGSESPRQQM